VRYVRNINDVGHLEQDADDGEDKIAKKARLEQLEPMEIAHYYTERYRSAMRELNVLSPSIEPHASGHIIEQIEMVRRILDAGYAYESSFAKEDDLYGVSLTTIRTDLEFKNPKFSHYVGVGVGYRGRIFIAQAAYQMKMQTYHLHAHEYQDMPYEMNALTHRVVLTLSWHD
jgi:hypothetical protein